MKLLKNKFFVTVIAIAIVMSVVPTVLSLTGHTDLVASGISAIASPFRAAFNFVADGISGFGEYFKSIDTLIEENKALREELETYKSSAARAELAEKENAWLREQMDFAKKYSDYTFCDAKVTGRSSNSYSVTYSLDRGSESGIEVNMAVITPGGVAGYIKEVGIGWSRAVAIIDPTSAVGVATVDGTYGTVEGSVEYRDKNYCIMNSDREFEVGTQLYSSGYGNIYPPELPVGKIVSSVKNKYTHTVTYLVEPSVELDGLTRVFIVTGRDTGDEVNGGGQ